MNDELGFDSWLGQEILLFSKQTGPGAHPPPYVKRSGCEADHVPPSSVKVKNGGAILPFLHTSSWCDASPLKPAPTVVLVVCCIDVQMVMYRMFVNLSVLFGINIISQLSKFVS
jgi:hypothetical protein